MIINGKEYDFEALSILKLLRNFNLNENKVVVEVNLKIIPKEDYKNYVVNKSDKVEVVAFVGGG